MSLLSRPARTPLLVAGLAVAAAATAGIAWEATGKTATLTVDGTPRTVDFRGSTAADVLAAAGVDADERDLLVPAAGGEVADGGEVALRRARPLELVVDGKAREVWVTATSVDEALDQVGLRERGLALSASRSRDIPLEGLKVAVTTPKDIKIVADGRTLARSTTEPTVRDALIEAGVRLDGDDKLSHLRAAPTADGLVVRVTRMRTDRVVEPEPVAFSTTRRPDATLVEGRTKVVREGRTGKLERTVQRTFVDGKLAQRTLVGTKTVAQPVARVVAVGTKPRPVAAVRSSSGGGSAGGGGAWAAVANCESGGNPSAVSSTGKYRGLYQFSTETWRSVGGSGDPAAASAAEQTRRAQMLLARSGAGQWPECGRYLR